MKTKGKPPECQVNDAVNVKMITPFSGLYLRHPSPSRWTRWSSVLWCMYSPIPDEVCRIFLP